MMSRVHIQGSIGEDLISIFKGAFINHVDTAGGRGFTKCPYYYISLNKLDIFGHIFPLLKTHFSKTSFYKIRSGGLKVGFVEKYGLEKPPHFSTWLYAVPISNNHNR